MKTERMVLETGNEAETKGCLGCTIRLDDVTAEKEEMNVCS